MPRNKLSPYDRKVRETISTSLKKLGKTYTQQQVSDGTGIPVSTLSGYFAKRSTPNEQAVQKLANFFGVSIGDIDPRYSPAGIGPVDNQDNITHIFAQNLKALMDKRGENLTQLSDRLDVAFSTVSDWQHGRKMPRSRSLQKIADHYGVEVSTLISKADVNDSDNLIINVQDDSMAPTITQNSQVVINADRDINDRDIVAAFLPATSKVIIRRIYHFDAQILLVPDNYQFTPTLISARSQVKILGKASQIIKKL